MALKIYESDIPRTFHSKLAEYVQKPAWPSLRFLKAQVRVTRGPGRVRIDFAVRSGLPIPLIYAIWVEAYNTHEGEMLERGYEYDHIGPLSTDDWTVEISEWVPSKVVLRVGIEPFEIGTDRVEIVL